jgi:hypothetical protein
MVAEHHRPLLFRARRIDRDHPVVAKFRARIDREFHIEPDQAAAGVTTAATQNHLDDTLHAFPGLAIGGELDSRGSPRTGLRIFHWLFSLFARPARRHDWPGAAATLFCGHANATRYERHHKF